MGKLIILDAGSFPYGYAFSEKIKQFGKIVIDGGNSIYVTNKSPVVNYNQYTKSTEIKGTIEGINYVYFCGMQFTPKSFLLRLKLAIKGFINEFIWLVKASKSNEKVTLVISISWLHMVIYYRILSLFFGFDIVISIMEYHESFKGLSFKKRIKARLFDRYSFNFSHKVITISQALNELVIKQNPNKAIFKLPVLANYQSIDKGSISEPKYLLFCGSIGYEDVIKFILDSFSVVSNTYKDLKLVLILNGKGIARIKGLVLEYTFSDKVKIFTGLEYSELLSYYKNAYALLIPLRPIAQDNYRFPQKIAEYLASYRPIVTTNVGEITNYFTDGENALIACDYNPESFAKKIVQILSSEESANGIGNNGRKLGEKYFDYRNYIVGLNQFLFNG